MFWNGDEQLEQLLRFQFWLAAVLDFFPNIVLGKLNPKMVSGVVLEM